MSVGSGQHLRSAGVETNHDANDYIPCHQDSDCKEASADKPFKTMLGCLSIGILGKVCVPDPLEMCTTASDCPMPSDCLQTSTFPFAICLPKSPFEAPKITLLNPKAHSNDEHYGSNIQAKLEPSYERRYVGNNKYIPCNQDSDCLWSNIKEVTNKFRCLRIGRLGQLCVTDPLETCTISSDCSVSSDCLQTSSFSFLICVPIKIGKAPKLASVDSKDYENNENYPNDITEELTLSQEQGNIDNREYLSCTEDSDCIISKATGIKSKLGCLSLGRFSKVCVQDPIETCTKANDCSLPSDCLSIQPYSFSMCVPRKIENALGSHVENSMDRLTNEYPQGDLQEDLQSSVEDARIQYNPTLSASKPLFPF